MIDSKSDESDGSLSQPESIQEQPQRREKKVKKWKQKMVLNVSDCQYSVVAKVGRHFGWKLQSTSDTMDWDVCWTDNAVQSETLTRMELHQKINHFPGMYNLARKNLLARALMRMRKQFPGQYQFFPMTWTLPVEYHDLKTYFEGKAKGKARTFIVKPECMSQGRGIFLTRKLADIEPGSRCVVQRYLHRPYLIDGLKFDLRIYVLVASADPLTLYLYHQGLGRFATEKYEAPNRQNMQQTCMHLTNYAINKDNPKFQFNKSTKDMSHGHKRSLTAVYQLLAERGVDVEQLKARISDSIIKTMISGLPHLTNTYRSCQPESHASNMCFQLLGFDVMLTEKLQPIVLEINHTPSFSTDTPLDQLIKFGFIRDSLHLMNINPKSKDQIVKQQKQACQLRVTTGKKPKLTPAQRDARKKEAVQKKMKYEKKNMGDFKRIYPLDSEQDRYQKFIDFSEEVFQQAMGGNRRVKKPEKLEDPKPSQPVKVKRPPSTFSTTPDLYRRSALKQQSGTSTNIKIDPPQRQKPVSSIDDSQSLSQSAKETSVKDSYTIMVESAESRPLETPQPQAMPLIIKDLQSPCQLRAMERKQGSKIDPKKGKFIENRKITDTNAVSKEGLLKPNSLFERVMKEEDDYLRQKQVKVTTLAYPQRQKVNNFTREGRQHEFRSVRRDVGRASRDKDKLLSKNSLQKDKQKVPIALNTLLINGLQYHQPLVSNLKKYMMNRQRPNE